MTSLPKAHGILPLTQAKATETAWHRLLAVISKPDFVATVVFCTIGLLTMLNLMLRFPGFGAIIQQYNQF